MLYMLDTNICIDLIRKRSPTLLHKLQQAKPGEVAVSAITLSELEYGVARSTAPEKNRLALAEFMTPIMILPYGDSEAIMYGRIRAHLDSKGTPIGALDTLIAAHALSRDLILVTTNEREFRRIPGLRVENWSA